MSNSSIAVDLDSLKKTEATEPLNKNVTVRVSDEIHEWLQREFGNNKAELVRQLLDAAYAASSKNRAA